MRRFIKLYRQIPGKDDDLPMMKWQDDEDGLPTLAPDKKKVGSVLTGALSQTSARQPSIFGSAVDQMWKGNQAETPLQGITEKPIRKNEHPFDQTKEEAVSAGENKINEIMYGEGEDWKDPIKAIDKGLSESKDIKTALAHSSAKEIALQGLAPTGFDAKNVLANSMWGKEGSDNATSKVLRDKANEYDKKVEGLRKLEPDSGVYPNPATLWDLKSEALKNYSDKDPQFKRNLEKMGVDLNNTMAWQNVPSVKMGSIMNEYLNDPDINAYLQKENSKLIPQFQQAHETLLTDNKDYGINVVANKVSQAIQKTGYNKIEPIFNFNNSGAEEMANLVAQDPNVLTPQELQIYNENIKDNQAKYLDKPSFTEGVASSIKDVYKGVASTLTTPFQSQSQNIKEQWIKEASNVNANPEGFMGFLRGAGRGTGFVMGLLSGAEVLGGGSTAHQLMIGSTVFGDALKEAETKYKSPVKAFTSAGLQTIGFMYFNNIFPSAKVGQLFNAAKPEINDIAVNLSKGNITQEAAKSQLTNVLNSVGKGVKQNVTASAQMTALVGVNRLADKMFGLDPTTYEKYNSQPLSSVFGHFFLDNSVVSGLAGYAEGSKERKMTENTLVETAKSPRQAERSIEEQNPANKEELLNTVKHVEAVHKELLKNNVPANKQGAYLLHSVAEKANKELAEKTTEPTIKQKYLDLAKKSNAIKEGILKGVPEDLIKQNQAIKEVKELYNEGYLPKGSMFMLESKKTPEAEGKFDEEKVKDYLKYVAQQSNNVTEDGEFNKEFDSRKAAKQIPQQVRDIANEMFPEYAKTAEEHDAMANLPKEEPVKSHVPQVEGEKELYDDESLKPVEGLPEGYGKVGINKDAQGDYYAYYEVNQDLGKSGSTTTSGNLGGPYDTYAEARADGERLMRRKYLKQNPQAQLPPPKQTINETTKESDTNIPNIKTEDNAQTIRSDTEQGGVGGDELRPSPDQSSENLQLDEKNPSVNATTEQQAGGGKPPTEEASAYPGEKENLTKVANAVNDAFMQGKFGTKALDDVMAKLPDADGRKVYDNTKARIEKGTLNPKTVRERVITTKGGNSSDQAALLYDLVDLKNKETNVMQEINSETDTKKKEELQKHLVDIQNEMQDNYLANRMIGRDWHNMGEVRKQWAKNDFSLAQMTEQYKATKGLTDLTPEHEKEIKQAYDKIRELEIKRDAARKEAEKAVQENEKLIIENEKLKQLVEKAKGQKKADRGKKADESIKKSNDRIQKAKDELRRLGGQLSSGVDPKAAILIGKIAAEKVYQGVVKFGELVKNIYDEVKDIFPHWTEEDVRNHLLPDAANLSKKYYKSAEGTTFSNKELKEKVDAYQQLQKEYALKRFQWQKDRRMDIMAKRPLKERIIDNVLRWQRFAILSYPSTIVKLASVVAHQLILKPFKFAFQALSHQIVKLASKEAASKQTVWGNPTWKALGKYYSSFIRNFSLENLKEHFSGIDTKEILYGKGDVYDEWAAGKGFLEMPGRSHGYIKSFIKNPEFQFAHELQTTKAIEKMSELDNKLKDENLTEAQRKELQNEYDNNDVTNEDVMERINKLSLEHGKWAILMNDNKFVSKFQNWADKKDVASALVRSEIPIVKIPVNYVSRAFATKFGLMKALTGSKWFGGNTPSIFEVIYKGGKELTPEQSDLLGKTLALGSMGASFFVMGYLLRKKIEINNDGSAQLFGVHISRNLLHSPEMESIFSGAETGNSFDKRNNKDATNWIKSFVESDFDIAKKMPFTNMLKYGFLPNVALALLSKDKDKIWGKVTDAIGKKIADMAIPGFVKQPAQWLDTKEPGLHPMEEPIRRTPKGNELERILQTIELNIPGLRENVPESGSSSSKTTTHNPSTNRTNRKTHQ